MSQAERPRRGEDAKADLQQTAIDCFARYGFQGTSIDRIAREAGVTKGAIYYHFKDKDDLLAAAVADRVARFEERVQAACRNSRDAEQSLRAVVAVSCRHAISNDRPRFAIKMMVESIDTHPVLRDAMRGMMRRYRAFVRNIVRSGQDAGLFRDDVPADAAAATLTSAIIGAETQFHLDPERFDVEGTLATFIDELCRGLRAPGTAPADAPATEAHAGGAPS